MIMLIRDILGNKNELKVILVGTYFLNDSHIIYLPFTFHISFLFSENTIKKIFS